MIRDQNWPPRRVSPRRLPVIVAPRLDATAADAPDAPEHLGVSPRLQSLHGARAVLPSKPSSHYGARAVLPSKRDKRTRSMTELLHSLSESEQQPLSETSDDVFALEMAAPLVSVPYLTDFRDVLKVIDARERVLQNIRTFLASMGFIRGSARSLPLPVLRRGRAKLAWLLARLRVHSTTVVELIQLWRRRMGAPLPPPSPRLLTSRQSVSAGSSVDSPAVAKSKQLTKAEEAAAVEHGAPPPKPRAPKKGMGRPPSAQEPFMWMGCNYLLKMRTDLRYAPLPTLSTPLLIAWFHYEPTNMEKVTRDVSLRRPPTVDKGNADSAWTEQEWWFDAERLHAPVDLVRMRGAQEIILEEAAAYGLDVSQLPPAQLQSELESPNNVHGREMEVLLYGAPGGYKYKLSRNSDCTTSAIKIQSLYNSFALMRRMKQRRKQRELASIIFIQRSYRNRIQVQVSANANILASLIKSHHKSTVADRSAKEAAAKKKADEQARRERRVALVRRRWVAVRSAVRELLSRKMSALRLQCLVRVRMARRRARRARQEKKMLTRQMNSGENARLSLGCTSIQSRFRAKRFCTATLLSHWHMRTSWYTDSRLSPLGRPLLPWLGEHRRQLRLALAEMKLEIGRLDGSEAHQLSALKKLWQVQGDLAIVELVKQQNSIEALAKRRLEYKLVLSGAQAQLERSRSAYELSKVQYNESLEEAHRTRGALELIELLRPSAFIVTVWLAGHVEFLRKRLADTEEKLEIRKLALSAARAECWGAIKNEAFASTALALASSLLSRHAASPSTETATATATATGEGGAPAADGEPKQVAGIPEAAVHHLAIERRTQEKEVGAAAVRFEDSSERREALQIALWWAHGALRTLDAVVGSLVGIKATRLERRRTEALGHCIATANTKIAYRVCKQAMAEVCGAEEQLAVIRAQHATLPKVALEVALSIPGAARPDGKVAKLVLEDVAQWMGVPDECFHVASWAATRDEESSGGKGRQTLTVLAHLSKGTRHPMDGEPEDLARSILIEFNSGRLNGGMTSTAAALEVAAIAIGSVKFRVPTKLELQEHSPPIAAYVEATEREYQQTCEYLTNLQQVRKADKEALASVPVHPEEVLRTVRRLLSLDEVAFFVEVNKTEVAALVSARSSSPAPVAGDVDALRQAIATHQPPTTADARLPPSTASGRPPNTAATFRKLVAKSHPSSDQHNAAAAEADEHYRYTDSPPAKYNERKPQSPSIPRRGRRHVSFTALGTLKGRLTYAKMRRDNLRGKLEAVQRLRRTTNWPPLHCPGDPAEVDVEWNKGVEVPAGPGQFCAYCALRCPPVLARHRYIHCVHRMLAGQAEFSQAALDALEVALADRRSRLSMHLHRLASVVEHRKMCIASLKEVQMSLSYLREWHAAHASPVQLPMLGPPRSLEPLCRPLILGHAKAMRQVAAAMADEIGQRNADELADLNLQGGLRGGEWGELKALLVMTPRRTLMRGGVAALAREERARQGHETNVLVVEDGEERPTTPATTPAPPQPPPPPPLPPPPAGEDNEDDEDDEGAEGAQLLALGEDDALTLPAAEDSAVQKLPEPSASTAAIAAFALRTTSLRKPLAFGKVAKPQPPKGTANVKKGKSPRAKVDEAKAATVLGPFAMAPDVAAAIARSEATLWAGVDGHADTLLEPPVIASMAERLGVDLSNRANDFFLLPLVVELCRAPLPGGWQEVLFDGVVQYVEEVPGATPQPLHPLFSHFARAIKQERYRTRRRREIEADTPPADAAQFWARHLQTVGDQWMLFADREGELYYHNFATGARCHSLHKLLYNALKDMEHTGLLVQPPSDSTSTDADGSSASATAPALGTAPSAKDVREVVKQAKRKEWGAPDEELRAAFLAQLYAQYKPLLATSIATAPRAVSQTLETARAYQLHPITEIELTWLADLALSLPVPVGWVHVEHPAEESGAHFWHNRIGGTSQWGHPVDDFIKSQIKMSRAPSHPQVRLMGTDSIARTNPSLLSGEPTAPASSSFVNKYLLR